MSSHLTPIIQFTMPDSDRWHPGTTFGVSSDGRVLILLDTGWATSAYHLPGSIQHLCLQALCDRVAALTHVPLTTPRGCRVSFRGGWYHIDAHGTIYYTDSPTSSQWTDSPFPVPAALAVLVSAEAERISSHRG